MSDSLLIGLLTGGIIGQFMSMVVIGIRYDRRVKALDRELEAARKETQSVRFTNGHLWQRLNKISALAGEVRKTADIPPPPPPPQTPFRKG